MHHILVLQLHMLWSRVPIDPKRNWTNIPVTKLFLSRKTNQNNMAIPKPPEQIIPFNLTFNQQKNPNHGVYIATHHLKPTDSTATAWECSTLLGAVRSKRIRSFDLVPLQTGPRGLKIPRISGLKCHLKWISFFLGKLLNNSYKVGPKNQLGNWGVVPLPIDL